MTSPYSTTLLQQTVEEPAPGERADGAQVDAQPRSVTHVVGAPVAPVAPQPVYVVPARPAAATVNATVLALIVLIVGVVALVGTFLAVRYVGPTPQEQVMSQQIALRDGYRAGRERGIDAGRAQALEQSATSDALRASIARERAYASAYQRGLRQGRSSYRPARSYGWGGSGYGIDWGNGWGGSYEVAAANAYAQELSMATGSIVEVETY